MEWEIVSNNLDSISSDKITIQNRSKSPPVKSKPDKFSVKPSRRKQFNPTPSPPPIELDYLRSENKDQIPNEEDKNKKLSTTQMICIGVMVYFFSEFCKNYLTTDSK